MNKATLVELILEDPSIREMLTVHARKDLFLYHLNNRPEKTYATKREEASELYLLAKRFGVSQTDKILAEHFKVPRTTVKKRIGSARNAGLLPMPRAGNA
jgi:hypothetical protein